MKLPVALLAATVLASPAASQVPGEWARDVRALLAAMDSIHPAPYRVHSRAEWERAAAELEARIPSLRYHEYVAGLARLVALAADGHTRLGAVRLADHQRAMLDPLPGEGLDTFYPLEMEVFADGLYATRVLGPHLPLLGRKIVAVNGIPTADAFGRFRPYLAADNEAWRLHLFPTLLRSPGFVSAAGLADTPNEPLRLTLQDSAGRRSEYSVPPGVPAGEWMAADRRSPGEELPLARRTEGRYGLHNLSEPRAVYVWYREVQNMEQESIAAFANRLFRFVDSVEAERLIIDVRRNGGGNNYLNQPLIHGIIRSARINRLGRLFVLIDRGTFSAAISFVGDAERHTHALFAGEPTGSPINQYGDSRRFRLPGSGIEVRISSLYWQLADPRDARPWVQPDIPVAVRFADWANGRDPVLDAVLAYRHDESALVRAPNLNWRRASQWEEYGKLVEW